MTFNLESDALLETNMELPKWLYHAMPSEEPDHVTSTLKGVSFQQGIFFSLPGGLQMIWEFEKARLPYCGCTVGQKQPFHDVASFTDSNGPEAVHWTHQRTVLRTRGQHD